jgi:hypothetical protein
MCSQECAAPGEKRSEMYCVMNYSDMWREKLSTGELADACERQASKEQAKPTGLLEACRHAKA